MNYIIKEQNVEIITFDEFLQETCKSHLEYLKTQISPSDFDRLQEAIKKADIVECAAITKSWHIDLENISSGMFRKYIRFSKQEDGSYKLKYDGIEVNFSSDQVLFIFENGVATPINMYHRGCFIINSH